MGYARTLAIALFNGGARRICAIAIIDLLTLPQWGLGNFSLPLVSRLGVEPRNLAVPDFKSVLQFAVRGFTKTQYTNRSGAFTSFANGSYLESWKFADLRHTLCLTFTYIQPMGRHGLSFGERPLTSGPSLSTKSHAGLVYLQLSPAIQKYLIITN